MGIAYNPRTITDGLVLCLDAANTKSVPKTNILTTWVDYGGNQTNYEVLGAYSVKLKNTTTEWVGYFPATVSSTGKYVITFTYYSDSDGSSLVLDNDGIMDNTYNTTLTVNITPQTYTGSVDVNTTGNIQHFFRRNGGGNIYVTNVSYFKLETTWTDLSTNGNTGTLVNGVGYSASNGGSLSFDGSNDYVTTSAIVEAATNSNLQTISGWMIGDGALFGSNANGTGQFHLRVSLMSNVLTYRVSYYGGAAAGEGDDTVSVTSRSTNNIVIVKTAAEKYDVYFNAEKVLSQVTKKATVSVNFYPGYYYGGVSWNSGNVSNYSIYNRALSAAEIQQNYNALKSRYI